MSLEQSNIVAAFHEALGLMAAGDFKSAEPRWREITTVAPASAEAWANLGISLLELGRFDEAEAGVRRAVAMKPGAPWAHQQLGKLLTYTGRWREAVAPFQQRLALDPSNPAAKLALAYAYLGLGDYERGGPLYESRMDVAGQGAERLLMPNQWTGESVAGKSLLIWPEQGFGDQIQFARFAPLLQQMGADVTLVCPPPLVALFQTLGVRIVEQSDETTLAAPDYWTLPLSIPHRLGMSLEDVPAAPYLRAPDDARGRWVGVAPPRAVGFAWRGRATHANDAHRSLASPEALRSLIEDTGRPALDLVDRAGDFAELAALVEQLDLVITVDTAVAHLAGALGKPCWILLPWYRQDWRWLQGRADTPWYPSVRLFRQPEMGQWNPVFDEVRRVLQAR
jgi:hypothetical protein